MDEKGWPCQRLRLGIGALIFFAFEVLIGKQLPVPMTMMIPAVGVASLMSARSALMTYKLQYQIALIEDAFRQARGLR